MNASTHIMLIDDHGLFRESLVRLLDTEPDVKVVAHCGTLAEALSLLSEITVDLILLDYDLGAQRGTELLRELRALQPPPKVMMVTAGMSESVTRDALNAGVAGVLYKHNKPDQLVEAIRKIARGEIWLDEEIARSLAAEARSADLPKTRPLTERQKEVLSGIMEGLTNKEIAWNLKVSESSVKAVIQELFHKTGVRTRSQLVRIAIERHTFDWLGKAGPVD